MMRGTDTRPGTDTHDQVHAAERIAARSLASRAEGEAYVASVCFKHGPPRLTGVELEYLVHHDHDPSRPIDPAHLARVLAPHTPRTVDAASPAETLPNGSELTMEPGGQIEISTRPHNSLAALATEADADLAYLTRLLAGAGYRLRERAIDNDRAPRRVLRTERYAAMERRFAPMGTSGITMMCSTAALQVCLDVGEASDIAPRWAAAHVLGPALLALFANSPVRGNSTVGSAAASARWLAVRGTEAARTRAVATSADPAAAWARRVLDTPLMVLPRRAGVAWDAPAELSFADWIAGRGAGCPARPPTTDDLDYHLNTMFTPVRARGYLELRYLDTQPPDRWLDPVALLHALLRRGSTVDAALEAGGPAEGRWESAAARGLADPVVARSARALAELGCARLPETGLASGTVATITENVQRRLHRAGEG